MTAPTDNPINPPPVGVQELASRSFIEDRYRNKGTAFSNAERDRHGLHGLLPAGVETLETQLRRVDRQYKALSSDIDQHRFLRALQELNSVLFYAFVQTDLEAYLPVIYTPTVGDACQSWSEQYSAGHGVYLSWPNRHRVGEILAKAAHGRNIDLVVATNGERVLGLGDLGAGGMGISIGKLALYSAVGGVDPATTLPVLLDAGTDNEALLADPLYLGWRHHRVRGAEFDELVDAFVDSLRDWCPTVVLQWEDFGRDDADRLLQRHRSRLCSFNDDIQGTSAVAVAAILSGLRTTEVPLADARILIVGAGSAGCGIANGLTSTFEDLGVAAESASGRVWLSDQDGLVHEDQDGLTKQQRRLARPASEVAEASPDCDIGSLSGVVSHVKPHVILGVCGQPGVFDEVVIRTMHQHVQRPIVLALSNPTSRTEAVPEDVLLWTKGEALVGTGSPFSPVVVDGKEHRVAQINNVYSFPGVGLGAVAVSATKITDRMLTAAAMAIAEHGDDTDALLPPVGATPAVAREVALAVATASGSEMSPSESELRQQIDRVSWKPEYP